MIFRTAGLQARLMIHERAWRPAVREDYSAATAVRSFAVSTSSTLKSAVTATP